MPDRLLLESGAPDGYLLEDGSGVLLQEEPVVVTGLTDNFDAATRDADKWALDDFHYGYTPSGSVTVEQTGGRLRITATTTANQYNGYRSVNTYDLTSGSVFVSVPTVLNQAAQTETVLGAGALPSSGNWRFVADLFGGVLRLYRATGSQTGTFTELGTVTYDATAHRWWRLRFDATNVYFDTASASASDPPASGDWVNRVSSALPGTNVTLTTAYIGLVGGTYANAAGPGFAEFDGLNTATTGGAISTSTGSASVTEVADAASATGTVRSSGSAANTETADTASASGTTRATGSVTATEIADTASASGTTRATGSATATEIADTASAAGTTQATGSATATEIADTAAATGGTRATGEAAATESADTASATGASLTGGAMAGSEANDNFAGAGAVKATAQMATTEDPDIPAGSGTVSATAPAAGSAAIVEANDNVAGVGAVHVAGTGSATGANDTSTGVGALPVTSALVALEDVDQAESAGTVADFSAAQGLVRIWNGSAWVSKPVKIWNGSVWVAKPAKVWNGSAWANVA